MKLRYLVLAAVLGLSACASRGPAPKEISDGRCLAIADALKTLRVGDPLPRVKEVMGNPERTYRVTTTFGGKYDVLDYDTGLSSCARFMLDAPKRLTIMFDEQGRLISYGRTRFIPLQGASSVRLQGGAASGY